MLLLLCCLRDRGGCRTQLSLGILFTSGMEGAFRSISGRLHPIISFMAFPKLPPLSPLLLLLLFLLGTCSLPGKAVFMVYFGGSWLSGCPIPGLQHSKPAGMRSRKIWDASTSSPVHPKHSWRNSSTLFIQTLPSGLEEEMRSY